MTMTSALARDPGPNVRVTALRPGMIDTDFHNLQTAAAARRTYEAAAPPKRQGAPMDAANLVLFRACDGSTFLAGSNMDINGGSLVSQGRRRDATRGGIGRSSRPTVARICAGVSVAMSASGGRKSRVWLANWMTGVGIEPRGHDGFDFPGLSMRPVFSKSLLGGVAVGSGICGGR